ncbi:MAG: hypothetical protein WCP32_00775 [Bacteroidota bacterium]
MKKFIISAFFLLAAFTSITAQNLIAVQNGGAPAFYLQVDSAIVHSQNGDTIYIPGGSWNISQPIHKRLHIIGVGHNPDSTLATFSTSLIGNVVLAAGADNGSLTGVYITGRIQGTNDTVTSYTVSRCNILANIDLNQSYSNFTFIENIFQGNNFNGSFHDCSFFNNIIFCSMNFTSVNANTMFKNNIFHSWITGLYSLFENNVFRWPYDISFVSNSTFNNNLFVGNFTFPFGTNVGTNNIVNQPWNTIFVNQNSNTFSYTDDYHLQPNCPGKNAGTDGTDIGIYGGLYPWKDGSVPFNPHFQYKNISGATDQSGNLNVNIKVAAQDH